VKEVIIYTDGACRGNPGNGGWGAVLIHGNLKKELFGGEYDTTNNRMELLAVIRALESLKEPCQVKLYSDSSYVVNAFELGWLISWKSNQWRTAAKKPVMNQDLWKTLDKLVHIHQVQFYKVKGHSTDELNNRCDYLATTAIPD